MSVRLRLLGGLAVEQDGVLRPVPFDRPTSLLVHLAVRDAWVDRAELAFLYRPDRPEAQALGYLRKLVFRARRLAWAAGLELEGDRLRWSVDSDVRRFRAALNAGSEARALDAYGGPFLGGATLDGAVGFAAWQDLQRDDLERAWLQATGRRAAELSDRGRHAEATALLERVLRHDPLDEGVVRAHLRSLCAEGRRHAAARAFEAFRETLQRELGVPPLEATQALADGLLRDGAPAEAGPVAPGPGFRLPAPATPFVGRRREVARIERLLRDEGPRLVTLVGLGGSGKTRLALQVAENARDDFADGAAFVSLAATGSAAHVAAAIVEALDLPWSDTDPERALVAGLRDRHLLLLLDEFEGVIDAGAALARLLEALPGLTVLATSREALEVRGEWIVDVAGLDVPPEGEDRDLEEYEAVRLFLARAARVAPDFVATGANVRAIAAICRSVAGLPLAIELAATWSRALDPQALKDELDRNAMRLTSGLRDVPDRHRSLWSVFDYTGRRLPPAAREALSRLTVFRDGFTLDAALRVAGADLEVLTTLLNRALVRREGDGRFAMHALVHQYALLAGPAADAEDAHARYYVDLLVRRTPDLKGRDPTTAVAQIHTEFANVDAAWDHAVRTADVALLDAGRDALDHYFHYRSRWRGAAEAFGRAVDAIDAAAADPASRRVRARLLLHLAQYERSLGSLASARERAREAVALLRDSGTPVDAAYARLEIATGAYAASEYDEAGEAYAATIGAALALRDRYLEGAAHNGLANVLCATDGDLTTAERHYRASLRAHTAIGNLEGVNGALINLGACRYDRGDRDEAARLWREAIEIAHRLGYLQREAVLHANLGTLAEEAGDHAEAFAHHARSLALREEVGDRPGRAMVLHNLGRLAHATGRYQEARTRLEAALDLHVDPHERGASSHVRSSLARTLAALGRLDEAEAHARDALAIAHEIGARHDILIALATRAELRHLQGRPEHALRLAAYVAREAEGTQASLRERAAALVAHVREDLPAARANALLAQIPGAAARALAAEELRSTV